MSVRGAKLATRGMQDLNFVAPAPGASASSDGQCGQSFTRGESKSWPLTQPRSSSDRNDDMTFRRRLGLTWFLAAGLAALATVISVTRHPVSAAASSTPDSTSGRSTDWSSSGIGSKQEPLVRTFSVASLHNHRLDACIDLIARLDAPDAIGADFVLEPPADLPNKLAKLGAVIQGPCVEQFPDHAVLATCVATTRRDGQILQLVERYYEYTTVGLDDARMEECLRLGGDWNAIARSSPEFLHAKRSAIVQEFADMVKGT